MNKSYHLYLFLKQKKQRYQKEISKVNKCVEQESVRILAVKCMEQWEHNVEMDIWSLQKIFIF